MTIYSISMCGQKTLRWRCGTELVQAYRPHKTSSMRMRYEAHPAIYFWWTAHTRKAGDVNRIRTILPDLVSRAHQVYTDMPTNILPHSLTAQFLSGSSNWRSEGFPKVLDTIKQTAVQPLRPTMNNLRLFKSEAEIRNMRKAGQASARAFTEAMRKGFGTERELWAFLDYRFKMLGCDGSAYVPVVAGGKVRLNVGALRRLLMVPECVKHTLCPQR